MIRPGVRERFLRDPLPIRLGGLAADLARISSFSDDDRHSNAVLGLLEESKFFIEWTGPAAPPEVGAELASIQVQLALWQVRWDRLWPDPQARQAMADQAALWSRRILDMSGLLRGGRSLQTPPPR